MTRDDIIAKQRETVPALRAEGVTRLAIFGSRARGDARRERSRRTDRGRSEGTARGACPYRRSRRRGARTIKAATGIVTEAEMLRSLEPRFVERIADDLI
jgi:hypothetical protein